MKAPRVVRTGTAKELAEAGIGYTSNGVSEHSRHSSKAKAEYDFHPRAPKDLTPGELLVRTSQQLAKLTIDLRLETSPEKVARIRRDIKCKTELFERLKDETRRTS
jgi:hypothetical protein